MDQTELFRATVKAIRLRIKAQQRESGSLTDSSSFLFKSSRKSTPFATNAKEVVSECVLVLNMREVVGKEYVNPNIGSFYK